MFCTDDRKQIAKIRPVPTSRRGRCRLVARGICREWGNDSERYLVKESAGWGMTLLVLEPGR
jgi:hypothetical protein